MSDHALLSPSRRSRFKPCPGSVREESKYPEAPSGPAATDGTHTHTVLEHCIKGKLISANNLVGIKLEDHDGVFVVDQDRADRVNVALKYIKARLDEHPDSTIKSESRVSLKYLFGHTDLDGTVDVQLFHPHAGIIELIDYKDGVNPVDATLQLEQYAAGVLSGFEIPVNLPYPYHTIRLTTIQPKLVFKGLNPITTIERPVSDILNRVVAELAIEAYDVKQPDAPLVPGETQCKYCRAKGSCSALASNVMKEIGVMFQPTAPVVPVEPSALDIAQSSANKDPAVMDGDQIRQILEAAPLLRQLIEGVEEEALRRLQAGQLIPGLKLVNGRGSRQWAFDEDQMAEKLIKMGIPKGSVYVTKLVSPAQAAKLTWEKRDGTKVQLTKRQLERMEQEYVVKMAGKLTVAPESDSRPAVVMDAAPMFSAVEAVPVVESLPFWLAGI